jgi:hypothetical protein
MALRRRSWPPQPSEHPAAQPRVRDLLAAAGWRRVVSYGVAYVVLAAAFPRLRPGVWFSRLGPRGRLVFIALTTLSGFATRELARRARRSHERVVAELRDLGLEPTEDEVRRHYIRRYLRKDLGREPTAHELDEAIARFLAGSQPTRSAPSARENT